MLPLPQQGNIIIIIIIIIFLYEMLISNQQGVYNSWKYWKSGI